VGQARWKVYAAWDRPDGRYMQRGTGQVEGIRSVGQARWKGLYNLLYLNQSINLIFSIEVEQVRVNDIREIFKIPLRFCGIFPQNDSLKHGS